MIIRGATKEDLEQVLGSVNLEFECNVVFKKLQPFKHWVLVRLAVVDSSRPGAGRGWTGRKLTTACWHVHGCFFEKLLELRPGAVIVTQYGSIDINGGNWHDHNRGSLSRPMMMSEMCECNGREDNGSE